jgi:hypothetical protein
MDAVIDVPAIGEVPDIHEQGLVSIFRRRKFVGPFSRGRISGRRNRLMACLEQYVAPEISAPTNECHGQL